MIYSTAEIKNLSTLISEIKEKVFDINTQYKFLKIAKAVKEEEEFVREQELLLLKQYGEKDKNGNLITSPDGGVRIQKEFLNECGTKVMEINNRQIQLPDIYFSLDELEPLGLTFGQLVLLDPFIK